MTPQSPAGLEKRRGRYSDRMKRAKTQLAILWAEYEYLRTVARRVDPRLLDEILRPAVLALRASRVQIQEHLTQGKST